MWGCTAWERTENRSSGMGWHKASPGQPFPVGTAVGADAVRWNVSKEGVKTEETRKVSGEGVSSVGSMGE